MLQKVCRRLHRSSGVGTSEGVMLQKGLLETPQKQWCKYFRGRDASERFVGKQWCRYFGGRDASERFVGDSTEAMV